jgi:hypothetical protein
MFKEMRVADERHGFLILETSSGRFVVVHRSDDPADLALLAFRLAAVGALEGLFFESIEEARDWLDAFVVIVDWQLPPPDDDAGMAELR